VSFRQFRKLNKGEFFVVFGDCAQGGADSNFTQFMSKTQSDIPLVFQMKGVAAQATPRIREALIWIKEQTGVRPAICLERNMGGSSEMQRLYDANINNDYTIYYTKGDDGKPTSKMGMNTDQATRPKMLGDWLVAFNNQSIKIYDEETISQHQSFIINSNNKPEADANTHDDAVMSCAGAFQLYQTENPIVPLKHNRSNTHNRLKLTI